MKIKQGPLDGLYIIEPEVYEDDRGYFYESFNQKKFKNETGLNISFVQDNQSRSRKGVLRGLHFQKAPYEQAKLVRAIEGEILDVAVDIRKDSATYGQHFSVSLSKENHLQLFIPRGYAHGFIVLSDFAEVLYKTDNYYHPESDSGIIYNDPNLKIDWIINDKEIILSEKDNNLRLLEKL